MIFQTGIDMLQYFSYRMNIVHVMWSMWYTRLFSDSFVKIDMVNVRSYDYRRVYTRSYISIVNVVLLDCIKRVINTSFLDGLMRLFLVRTLDDTFKLPDNDLGNTFYICTLGSGQVLICQGDGFQMFSEKHIKQKQDAIAIINNKFDVTYLANAIVTPNLEWTVMDMLKTHFLLQHISTDALQQLFVNGVTLQITDLHSFECTAYKDKDVIVWKQHDIAKDRTPA